MTVRGDRTRAALIRATTAVVAEAGYQQATTRAIARRAGISEGTIYRHFPDKRALFFAAVLSGHEELLAWMSGLPDRAGGATVAENLTGCLTRLAELRGSLIPLELALMTDSELGHAPVAPPPAMLEALGGPPQLLALYLADEQRRGRVNPDLDPAQMAIVLLATLFGLAAGPIAAAEQLPQSIAAAVEIVLAGIGRKPT